MLTKIIEASSAGNWGKFMVCRFNEREWAHQSAVSKNPLLARVGWDYHHIWVLDLKTGEGACFRHGGLARADLEKHQIWVCPLFEPFLEWLYKQDIVNLSKLPNVVELPHAPFALYGHRRKGPNPR